MCPKTPMATRDAIALGSTRCLTACTVTVPLCFNCTATVLYLGGAEHVQRAVPAVARLVLSFFLRHGQSQEMREHIPRAGTNHRAPVKVRAIASSRARHGHVVFAKKLGGELNSSAAEWLNKGLMAVWSPYLVPLPPLPLFPQLLLHVAVCQEGLATAPRPITGDKRAYTQNGDQSQEGDQISFRAKPARWRSGPIVGNERAYTRRGDQSYQSYCY
eukprot:1196074-Prorocentrum_minimum.AAC.3